VFLNTRGHASIVFIVYCHQCFHTPEIDVLMEATLFQNKQRRNLDLTVHISMVNKPPVPWPRQIDAFKTSVRQPSEKVAKPICEALSAESCDLCMNI